MTSINRVTKNGSDISASYDGEDVSYSINGDTFKVGGIKLKWHFLTDNIELNYDGKKFFFHPGDWDEICEITSELKARIEKDA